MTLRSLCSQDAVVPLLPCILRDVQRQREVLKIGLGADALNELLGGGVETKSITEIYGEYR